MANIEKSIYHATDVASIRLLFTAAILNEWLIPCIEPAASDYENENNTRSSFIVHDLKKHYRVTIEEL